MVHLGLRRVEDGVAAKHPALQQYAACQAHAFMKGIGTFLAGSGAAFAVQKLVNKKLPYPLQWNLLLSVAAGSLASYTVTRAETQKCSDFWIYLETGKSPQEHVVADRVPQPAEIRAHPPSCLPWGDTGFEPSSSRKPCTHSKSMPLLPQPRTWQPEEALTMAELRLAQGPQE